MSVPTVISSDKLSKYDTVQEQSPKQTIPLKELTHIENRLTSVLSPRGFECHPFKIGWYNEQVAPCFRLPYHDDTLSFVIISTPSMFEKAFIPFLATVDDLKIKQDPLDQCMVQCFTPVKEEFPGISIETIHDFEMTPNKRPKILVQTAGHIAGAVRLYQRKDLTSDPWDPMKKVFGVCLHPHYGGWFALRGVITYTSLHCPELPRQQPRDILTTEADVIELLQRYNDHWQDWSFRDIIPVKEKYSQEQREYFSTKPGDRQKLIEKYCNSLKINAKA
ncbi:cyanocobalamin reductase / alkylcobalamin dealkylase-like [Homarus americanus]|uniref:Cyanocobalamin reductase (cyanide-eliminating) n=1 Tax=Homarus americanus TaxID=6706 RepID=A0A8J5KBH2_HOMAM|nr:cyanocobalamin reductase / alkylcobalamin dealkylase-like [Homarus americanus]KAG7171252.1 Methylmalonic aciduria and homocystinuria type C protein-like [Homarus americanus]